MRHSRKRLRYEEYKHHIAALAVVAAQSAENLDHLVFNGLYLQTELIGNLRISPSQTAEGGVDKHYSLKTDTKERRAERLACTVK